MASIEATNESHSNNTITLTRLARYGLIAAILVSVLNGIVRILAVDLLDVPNVFALWWEPVLIASAGGAIGATIVYGVLTRVSNRPNQIFIYIAVIALVLSFVGPVSAYVSPPPELADAPWTVFATLIVMHVVAAITIVGVLTRSSNSEVTAE